MHFIHPSAENIERALESWQWLPLAGKRVIRVIAFGDCFLQDDSCISFLDTIEGDLKRVCDSFAELEQLLCTEEGQDHYLFGGFVERAANEGHVLGDGQCYAFKISPVVGGEMRYENISIQNFVVSVNLAGQLHHQIKMLPARTGTSGFTVAG